MTESQERTPEQKAETKRLYAYIKAYIKVKGFEADANYQKFKSPHYKFAKQLEEDLGSVAVFEKMLDNYGGFLTSKGKTGWNMKTMSDRAADWKKRQDAFEKKIKDKEVEF